MIINRSNEYIFFSMMIYYSKIHNKELILLNSFNIAKINSASTMSNEHSKS